MLRDDGDVKTFVVRIFVPAGDEELELTGIVEHSGTGRSEHFRGAENLVGAVLHQLTLDDDRREPPVGHREEKS